jgi:UDP-N-acetylmuramoyl-L-alanyl-D-glutamate--2,6-diaminopimelate ligase
MKSLSVVLDFFQAGDAVDGEEAFTELTSNSRQWERQTLFIALPGEKSDALDYVKPNDDRGKVVLTELSNDDRRQQRVEQLKSSGVKVIEIAGLRERLAEFADWFYDHPSQKLKVMGVTGTNGKSSTAYYAVQILEACGIKAGLMGTLGNGFLGDLQATANTTPDVVSVHRWLAWFVSQGAQAVVMEVSSHAVALGRIAKVQFAALALTQVTSDHLDFHKTLENYRATKKLWFEAYGVSGHSYWVLNVADVVSAELAQMAKERGVLAVHYAVTPKNALVTDALDLSCQDYALLSNGIAGNLRVEGETYPCRTSLMGEFNIENLLCALGLVMPQGFAWQEVLSAVEALKPVPGRMQVIKIEEQDKNLPTVIVDYAHTADGLAQALSACRQHKDQSGTNGKVWCVFGCGGERDVTKRPQMGATAFEKADFVVVTNDNPRCEPPQKIAKEILLGMPLSSEQKSGLEALLLQGRTGNSEQVLKIFPPQKAGKPVMVLLDRKSAIEWVIQQARPEDSVLIAGKGHETYQQLCDQTLSFSDAICAEQALLNRVKRYEKERRSEK